MALRSLPAGFASQVYQASTGEQALEVLQLHRVELVLLDLTMPDLDGIGVLQEIRRCALKVFVIVVSGDIQPQMRQRVLDLGALDFVPKPIKPAHLAAILTRFGLY